MTERIRRTDVLSDPEQQRLFRWSADPFGVSHLGLQWRSKDVHFLLETDGQPVSHVGVLRHAARLCGQPVELAGFGGVITVPHAQKRGHAFALMKHAAGFVTDEWGVNAGLLFCLPRMIRYYEQLGWRTLEQPVSIEQLSGRIPAPLPVMVLPFDGYAWPDGPVELDSRPW